jgi:hypothetical protein
MTVVLVAANPDQTIQVSDRRLTSNRRVIGDEFPKAISLECWDARMTVGFSGIAKAPQFDTQDWILRGLRINCDDSFSIHGLIKRFCGHATETFTTEPLKSVSPQLKRLTIMMTGYLYDERQPRLAQ